MKKIVLAAILCLAAGTLSAQSPVQNAILEHLRAEGYVPSIDQDDDIAFKIEGKQYYISVEPETDPDLYYISFSRYLYSDDVTTGRATSSCNAVNRGYKLVRCSWKKSDEDDKINYTVSVSCFVKDAGQYLQLHDRLKNCLQHGVEKLVETLYD